MKKALVIALMFVLGLGFAAFATGTFSGTWDTDISLYPAASEFGNFIKSFTTEVDVDYTVGGFVFGMESTFGLVGFTGMDFDVDGTLGAFTVEMDIDFDPDVLKIKKFDVYGWKLVSACGLVGVGWEQVVNSNTYTAGFDDMWATVSVNIAGVSFATTFGMEGIANEYAETVHTFWMAATPVYTDVTTDHTDVVQTGSYVNVDTTKVGTGWKFSASGSFGGATLTGLAYFNLSEASTYADNSGYADVYLADYFTKSGTFSLVCPDCIVRFSSFELLLEGVSFACTTFKALAIFDCCGFSDVKFLVEDIGLGCCWDLGFDLMITFTDKTKSIEIKPDITFANACFTFDTVVTMGGTGIEITGVEIRGLALEYSWNGITFTAEESFNLTKNPILGSYNYGYISSPHKIVVWEPDRDMTIVTYVYDETAGTCVASVDQFAIDISTGEGYWELKYLACERAYVWEHFGIDVDGDSCCGGAFDISADFYFGDVKELTILGGSYWQNETSSDSWGTELVIYGDGGTVPARTEWTDPVGACDAHDCCACVDGSCSYAVDTIDWDPTYDDKTADRLFDWVETNVDVAFAIGSNFELTFGLDVSLWGWEDFTAGFNFTF